MEKELDIVEKIGSPTVPQKSQTPESARSVVMDVPKRSIISRRGVGTCGRPIRLLSNHFKVSFTFPDAVFYQYTVC